jgi:flagellar motor switch/type III secretory pathway protein FliN
MILWWTLILFIHYSFHEENPENRAYLRSKTQNVVWAETVLLDVEKEVGSYGCSVKDIVQWRKIQVLEVALDDSGRIESVEKLS